MGSPAFRIVVAGRNYRFVVEEPTEREAGASTEASLRQLSAKERARLTEIEIACPDLQAGKRLKGYFMDVVLEMEMD